MKAQIMCPAYTVDINGRTVIDEMFQDKNRKFVPCVGVKVSAMDSDLNPDDYCGSAYTDSHGYVDFHGSCYDTNGTHPDIYLKIGARTNKHVTVGTHGWNFWDYIGAALEIIVQGSMEAALVPGGYSTEKEVAYDFLTSNDPFYWETPYELQAAEGDFLSFHQLKIGGKADLQGQRSGIALFAAKFSMHAVARSQHPPKRMVVTVNQPLWGSPTTIWNTIVMKRGSDFDTTYSLLVNALPHEAGHAAYNRYHSDWTHYYDDDMMTYMHSHSRCDQISWSFAWYEGFAEWVSDYAYAAYRDKSEGGTGFDIEDQHVNLKSCETQSGFAIEGNVAGVLNEIYLGNYRQKPEATYRHAGWIGERVVVPAFGSPDILANFSTPSLRQMLHFVHDGGDSAHIFDKFWTDQIQPYCAQLSPPISVKGAPAAQFPRYCASSTFITNANVLGSLP